VPELAFVFQDPALMPWATVVENVQLPGRLKGSISKQDVNEAIRAVGLEGMEARLPAQLSGGQRMRASVARALAANPKVLLMDEPFAALDEILRFQMNELLLELRAQRGLSILFVTHSLYEAAYLSDRVLVMDQGLIKGEVTPRLDRNLSAQDQRASSAFTTAVSAISTLMIEARR
jgi:NitT/TauT family transport system ATP-binding protein